jgi:NADPH-dependent 2,4-dienoyl-CoA reductase/sulfur reductase-like enzyme/rhodanese-related sulfurtransferase
MSKKFIIIGGSAAGPKAASKARRLDQEAEITIIQQGRFLSMASCGYPYYVGGVFDKQSQMVRDPGSFLNVKNIKALTRTRVSRIDRERKIVHTLNLDTNEENFYSYDKLVIATGAVPVVPPIPGVNLEGVTTLQSVEDAQFLKSRVKSGEISHAVVVGGGLIGVETAEAMQLAGIKVTIVERISQILSFMDWDMAKLVEDHIRSKGSEVITNTAVTEILGESGKVTGVKLDDGRTIPAQLVLVSVGVKPNTELAKAAGLETGLRGGIRVNDYLQTIDPDIYAAGDCIEVTNLINGEPTWLPMGDAANLQARVIGQNITVENPAVKYPGVVMTAICQAFEYTVGNTGLSEHYARKKGFPEVVSIVYAGQDKPAFMGAKPLVIKMVADKKTGKFLGMQAVGSGDVAKRVAMAAMALHAGMHVSDLVSLDLPYAPPYSPAIDNFIAAAHVLENKFLGRMQGIKAEELLQKSSNGRDYFLLDVRNQDEYEACRLNLGEVLIPLPSLRQRTGSLPNDLNKEVIVYCKVSLRGYEAATFIESLGYKNVKVLEGGITAWPYELISMH